MSRASVRGVCILAVLFGSACGDDDEAGIDPASVQDLPPGDAEGTALSGTWQFEAYTSACAGDCAAGDGALVFSVCDVGMRDEGTAMVVQDGGALQMDTDESFWISRMRGGVDADGGFVIGGFGTEFGGQLEIAGRVEGTIEGDEITAVATYRLVGEGEQGRVSCEATYEITGSR